MKPIDIYLEFGVTKDNVRSRHVEHVQNRVVLRQIFRDRKMTLRQIGEVEGSIDNGLPVHHSSILSSLKIDDNRTKDMKQKYAQKIAKLERQRRIAQDLQDAVREAPKPMNIRSAMREAGAMPAAGGRGQSFEHVTGIYPHVYTGAFGEQLREAKKQYEEAGTFDASLLIQRTETASERAIREKRLLKEALDRLKMRGDEQKSEAERVMLGVRQEKTLRSAIEPPLIALTLAGAVILFFYALYTVARIFNGY